jgi:very-short-patch-repair endonuclease
MRGAGPAASRSRIHHLPDHCCMNGGLLPAGGIKSTAPGGTPRRCGVCDRTDPSARARMTALLRRQHGVAARRQLLESGVTAKEIVGLVSRGELVPIHRGVYAAALSISRPARAMAAVLACGPDSVLSNIHGAARWTLLPDPPLTVPIDVTVARAHTPDRRGIRAHRIAWPLRPDERTILDRIPITTIARTLLDLAALHAAGELAERDLEQALAAGERRDRHIYRRLGSLIARYPTRRGTPALRRLLNAATAPAFARSEAERRALELFRSASLPESETNAMVRGASGRVYELDIVWRPQRVAVEIDGYAHHADREAFERDRGRDADLAATGWTVIRATWRQLDGEPDAVVARVALVLGARHA